MKNLLIEIENPIGGIEGFNYNLFFGCVGFWNKNGLNVWEENKAGRMGSEQTQEMARKLSYEDYILHNLSKDYSKLKMFTDEDSKVIFGRSGSHIWVSLKENNNRLIFIHF